MPSPISEVALPVIPAALRNGLVLILEDNFMIANDVADEIERAGFPNNETFSNAEDALEFLENETPVLALLDVNLGRGMTSEPVATVLASRGVPIIFVTGYGDKVNLPPNLQGTPILTKPISQKVLLTYLARIAV